MLTNRMLSLQTISRSITPFSGATRLQLHTSIKVLSSSSDSSDSGSDSDKEPTKQKPKVADKNLNIQNRKEGLNTLNTLITELNKKKLTASRINVAIPKRPPKPIQEKNPASTEESRFDEKLTKAAKSVAKTIGGNVKKTEMVLLDRLLKKKVTSDEGQTESKTSLDQSDILLGMEIINRNKQLSFNHEKSNSKSIYKNQKAERVRQVNTKVNNLQVQVKDNRTQIPVNKKPQDFKESSEPLARPHSTLWELYNDQKRVPRGKAYVSEGTSETRFHNRNFGIFEREPKGKPEIPDLSIWTELERNELRTLLSHPPANYFQEMIQWTEKGKIWQFPIDNEQGMEEEKNVHFSEHVFMERHLKGWCPKVGPIRHFMELVCVGLSKNAFMTVEEKIGHIMWYKDYFGDKRDLLKELGAVDSEDPTILPKPTNKIDLGPHP